MEDNSSLKQDIKYSTRQSSAVFGLGNAITEEDSNITGSRLPTCEQVLRCLMYHIQEGAVENLTRWQAAKLVLSKITPFYQKGNIPMIAERKACEKIIKLMDENAKIRAIPVARRSSTDSSNKVKAMAAKLKTFPLWPHNADKMIKNKEDLLFLNSMKSDRQASFGAFDKVLAGKDFRRRSRAECEARRRDKMKQELYASTATVTSTDNDIAQLHDTDSSSSDSPCDDDDFAVAASQTSRRTQKVCRGTSGYFPHDILRRPKVVALAARLKMTPAQQAAYTEALIAETGGDPSAVSSSYATADRSRCSIASLVAQTYKQQWVVPELLTLHWDSKLMPSLSNPAVSEERLTVVVGDTRELKLLGVPSYKSGTDRRCGDIIAELTINLLTSWNCADSVVNMTFDTTASNTGSVTAACVTIQQKLGRALLWSACRHHVGEIILTHVFQDLHIETSKSPEITLFARFRKNFDLLPHSSDQLLAKYDSSSLSEEAQSVLVEYRSSVLELTKSELSFRRDNYREFAELCTLFLDGVEGEKTVTLKRPGALHKARWMAKLLYSIKICLLEEYISQLPRGTVTTHQQPGKIRQFVNFATLVYSEWWMTCSSAVDAPWYDLQLVRKLLKYKTVNPNVAESALRAFKQHLWYLTGEMVPLALFSSVVPVSERRALADKLMSTGIQPATPVTRPLQRFGTEFGKPAFPSDITESTTLADLVIPDSWYMMYILQLDTSFLADDVESWPSSAAYLTSAANVLALNVINDCAERGVKLSSDFLTTARSEQHYQNVLQVVEQDRKQQPNVRKRKHH